MDLKKYLPSWSFLIMILCFLLPFFIVKCNGNDLTTVKWINLLGIWEPTNHLEELDNEKSIKIDKKEDDDKIYFSIILLFFVMILGFWFSVKNLLDEKNWKKVDFYSFDKIYFWTNIFIIILLLYSLIDINSELTQELKNSGKEITKKMKEVIKIETWSWFKIIFLLAILNILYFWYELKFFENFIKKEEKNDVDIKIV